MKVRSFLFSILCMLALGAGLHRVVMTMTKKVRMIRVHN